LLETDI